MEVARVHGDGIGPAVVDAASRCLDALVDVSFVDVPMGDAAIEEHGTPLPGETVDTIRDVGLALKGPVTTPIGSGFRSVNVSLRKELDLYANVRPCTYLPNVPTRVTDPDDIDLVVIRENLEDVYAGIEFAAGSDGAATLHDMLDVDVPDDTAFSIKPISRGETERIIRYAFDYAVEQGRAKVTAVDKSNILKETDGMHQHVAEEIAEEYDIAFEHMLVDNMAQQLVRRPEQFDVIVTQNLYGDILSDLAGGLVGGIGMIPAANVGDEVAVFATVHGTAPDIAGGGVANPVAAIRSAALLLEHAGKADAAEQLQAAIHTVVENGPRTADLGGDASTDQMTDAVIAAVDA